ncbi:hypothetical protein ASE75_12140 [Sphingomonas sp. Leaf17]|nr:hypothetical protein ASE75_12140 [Sphingomonas sp. Leaf17]
MRVVVLRTTPAKAGVHEGYRQASETGTRAGSFQHRASNRIVLVPAAAALFMGLLMAGKVSPIPTPVSPAEAGVQMGRR